MKIINVIVLFFLICTLSFSQEATRYNLFTTSPLISNNIYCVRVFNNEVYVGQNFSLTKFTGEMHEHILENTPYRYYTIQDVLIVNEDEMWLVGPYSIGHYKNNEWEWISEIDGIDVVVFHRIVMDDSGKIWVTTYNGLFMYDNGNWTHFTEEDGVLAGQSTAIEVHNNDVYVVFGSYESSYGVSMFNGESWYNFTSQNGLIGTSVRDINVDPFLFVWFCTNEGVAKWNGISWEYFTEEDGLGSNIVNCMEVDNDGNYWFGTTSGVSKFNDPFWETFTVDDGLLSNKIAYLAYTDDNKLWIGTFYSGVSVMNLNLWEIGVERNIVVEGVKDFNLYKPYIDNNNSLWVQGNSHLTNYRNDLWTSYEKNEITNSNANILFEDRDENLIYGGGSSFSVFDGNNWSSFSFESPYPGTQLKDCVLDTYDNLWFASTTGVYSYIGTEWTNYTMSDNLLHDEILHIDCDLDNNIWCVAYNMGIGKFENDQWTSYPFPDDLIAMYIDGFDIDQSNDIWISSRSAIYQFDGEDWTKHDTTSGLDSYYYLSLVIDLNNNVWVGGPRDLYKYDGENWTTLAFNDGIVEGSIDYITVDDDNNLWFTCNACLWKLTQSNYVDIDSPNSQEFESLIYPNPAINQLSIEFQNDQIEVSIYDLNGAKINQLKYFNSPALIDLSGFSNGTYVFKIFDGKKLTQSKVIVSR
jgi:ligand-binding sensor domain-containing protein